MMTTLIFVRHGQSESNLARLFTGHTDVPLTPLGRSQAENTAEYLKDYPIDVIYASPLKRAMQTAEPTARMHGLEIIPNRELIEIYAGDWEGEAFEDIKKNYPESFHCWLTDIGHAHPDGGESVAHLADRVLREIDRLIKVHRGQCIAIFSHATPARVLGSCWYQLPIDELSKVHWVSNASVSIAEYDDDGSFRVLKYSYDAHHGGEMSTLPEGLA